MKHERPDPFSPRDGHSVIFYGDDEPRLIDHVVLYLRESLVANNPAVVIATSSHCRAFSAGLRGAGIDPAAASRTGLLQYLDAASTLQDLLVDGKPDWNAFNGTVGAAVRRLARRGRLRAYGEMVALLWAQGRNESAVVLERFWNRLCKEIGFDLLCAYDIDIYSSDFTIGNLDGIMCTHDQVWPAGDQQLPSALRSGVDHVLGGGEKIRPLMKANYRPAWAELPEAEATILWLRNNLPEQADRIIDYARKSASP